jgi:hypothetical protein
MRKPPTAETQLKPKKKGIGSHLIPIVDDVLIQGSKIVNRKQKQLAYLHSVNQRQKRLINNLTKEINVLVSKLS